LSNGFRRWSIEVVPALLPGRRRFDEIDIMVIAGMVIADVGITVMAGRDRPRPQATKPGAVSPKQA
jgi:hypothetical protein